MFLADIAAVVYDFRWLHGPVKAVVGKLRRKCIRSGAVADESVQMRIQQQTAASQPRASTAAEDASLNRHRTRRLGLGKWTADMGADLSRPLP